MANFEEIYHEHFTAVYKYTLSLCRDESQAEELTQETFFKAMRGINHFKGECKLYVWLCQIAKNTYFSSLKKEKRLAQEECQADTETDLERDLLDREAARKLHILLHNLKEPYKEVFTLRVFGELPFSQIGGLFGKSDSWARLVYYRAKKQLGEAMK